MADREDLMLELLQEVREDQKVHSSILGDLKNDVATNTADLAEHIEGVNQNRKRIRKLERPWEFMRDFRNIFLGVSGLAGATYGLIRLFIYAKGL